MAIAEINGVKVTMTLAEVMQLVAAVSDGDAVNVTAAKTAKAAKAAKTAKTAKTAKKPRYDSDLLDSARVERMVQTAIKRFASKGIEVIPYKVGSWVWLKPINCDGRSEEFRAMKESLPDGWHHSMKRGQYRRAFA